MVLLYHFVEDYVNRHCGQSTFRESLGFEACEIEDRNASELV